MAITLGHTFHAKHGFTGSAEPEEDHRPQIPGYKYGGEVEKEVRKGIREHEDAEHGGKHSKLHLKEGGWVEGAKEHFNKKDHVDHDGEMHNRKVNYDEHGFQSHKHGGRVK